MGTFTHASMLTQPVLVPLWVGLFSLLIALPDRLCEENMFILQ